MPRTEKRLNGLLHRWRARRARLPWHELEAEAARQGCSPADIFFDRAGLAEPDDAGPAPVQAEEPHEQVPGHVPWRGLDPRPAARAG